MWARPTTGDQQYWRAMSYAPRDYRACEHIVGTYTNDFPNMEYRITADSDLCRPVG
jgi:hypothetical protein